MSEEDETPEPDWAELSRQARYVEQQAPSALRRLIEAARVAQARLGPTVAAGEELARTVDGGIREVLETLRGFGGQPPLPTGAALMTGAGTLAVAGVATVGAVALQPMTITGKGRVTAEAQVIAGGEAGELKRKLPGLSPGVIYAALLVLLVSGDMTLIEMYLSPQAHMLMEDGITNASILASFAVWLWRQGHKGE